jgi:hypothetical protein
MSAEGIEVMKTLEGTSLSRRGHFEKETSQHTKTSRACCDRMGFTRFTMRYRVMVEQDEDGFFVAECPSLPGYVSQGSTR